MRILLVIVVAALIALVLTSGDDADPTPAPPSKAQQQADAYRACVGTDRSRGAQDRCQRHIWGETFGEDDHRWLCDRMGNWQCALRTEPKL